MSLFPSSTRSTRSFRETNFPQFTFNCAETYPAFSQCSFYYRCYVVVLHRAPFSLHKKLCVCVSFFYFHFYLFNSYCFISFQFNSCNWLSRPSLAWPSLSFFFIIIFLLFIVISHQTQYFPLFNSTVSTNNRFLVVFRFPVPT